MNRTGTGDESTVEAGYDDVLTLNSRVHRQTKADEASNKGPIMISTSYLTLYRGYCTFLESRQQLGM